jgi:hypothetical protein
LINARAREQYKPIRLLYRRAAGGGNTTKERKKKQENAVNSEGKGSISHQATKV